MAHTYVCKHCHTEVISYRRCDCEFDSSKTWIIFLFGAGTVIILGIAALHVGGWI